MRTTRRALYIDNSRVHARCFATGARDVLHIRSEIQMRLGAGATLTAKLDHALI